MYDDRRVSPGGAPPFIWTNDQGQTEAHYRAHHPEIAAFRQRLYEREMHVSSLWPNLSPELLSSLSSFASLILGHRCRQVKYSVGSALFYRLDLWHHGTRCLPGRTRRAMQFSWRRVSWRRFAHPRLFAHLLST